MEHKEFYTTGEIAKCCGVNFRTVLRWIQKGKVKAYKLPGGRGDHRVKRNDLISFLMEYDLPIPENLKPANRLLVVDDDSRMANSIQRLLKREGFETTVCTDGFKAGMMTASLLPQLMILDLNMPGMGGMDVLQFVRDTEALKNIKILVVSAMPQKDLEAALQAGADDILSKPFDGPELLERVKTLLGNES